MAAFDGFPPDLFEFYEGLEKDNSKEYWEAHRETWEKQVKAPVQALLQDLSDEFPDFRMFRPNRDLRFSKDKSPYKLSAGATTERDAVGGVGYYLRVEATGIVAGGGAMVMTTDQLERFRAAIDDERSGAEFESLADELAGRSLPVSPGVKPLYKNVPKPYPKDHPRAEYLRWKGAVVIAEFERDGWMETPQAADRVRDALRGARSLTAWLESHLTTDP